MICSQRNCVRLLRGIVQSLVWAMAGAFVLQFVLALFGIPGFVSRWLAAEDFQLSGEPRFIAVLGGGGIPSESGLMRTYYAAQVANQFPGALLIVSLPTDSDPDSSHVGRMRDEITLRGVRPERIRLEFQAVNTFQQVANICSMVGPNASSDPILVVTSPYHLRRALLCFRKQGFSNVSGVATATTGADAEADIGDAVALRYSLWLTLKEEIPVVREFVALAYYKLRGWI